MMGATPSDWTMSSCCTSGGVRDLGLSLKLDVLAGRLAFHEQVLARKRSVRLEDQQVPVASAEDLILLELLARRPIDLNDAEELYRIHKGSLDEVYLRSTAQSLRVVESLDAVIAGTG